VQGCRGLTSGCAFGSSAEMRVSRVDFSGPYQGCIGMRTQGVRGEIWPVSCGFAAMGELRRPGEVLLRVRA
jgi:hypothetical protein